jgi:fructose-bisphosphate aldolase class 1
MAARAALDDIRTVVLQFVTPRQIDQFALAMSGESQEKFDAGIAALRRELELHDPAPSQASIKACTFAFAEIARERMLELKSGGHA